MAAVPPCFMRPSESSKKCEVLPMENTRDTLSGKMSPARSHQTKARTSGQSSKRSAKSKMPKCQYLFLESGRTQEGSWETATQLRGGSLTLSFGEFPNAENVSTLSQILQVGVPEKYYLSQKACLGILRRASARGKQLPELLRKALEKQAASA